MHAAITAGAWAQLNAQCVAIFFFFLNKGCLVNELVLCLVHKLH